MVSLGESHMSATAASYISSNNSSISNSDNSTASAEITDSGQYVSSLQHVVHVEEVVVLAVIVTLWVVAVVVFLRKWASIRILQPVEPRYKHAPKNLEHVRVVKRVQDSVIYKNYSRKMSVTMVAREKRRLQRMHTVPCMSPLPTIHMEEVTSEM